MRRKEPYGTARVVQHFQLTELRPSIHPSAHSTLVVLPLLLLRYILYFLRRGRWREKTFVRFWLDGYRSSSRRSSSGGSILNQRSPVFLFQSFHFPRCSVPMPVGRKRMEGGKKSREMFIIERCCSLLYTFDIAVLRFRPPDLRITWLNVMYRL